MPLPTASNRGRSSRRGGSRRAVGLFSSVALGAALLLPGAPAQGVGAAGGTHGAMTSTPTVAAAVVKPSTRSTPSQPLKPSVVNVPTVLDDAVVIRWAAKSTTQQRATLLTHAGLSTLSTASSAVRSAPGLVDVSVVRTTDPAMASRSLSGAPGVVWAERLIRYQRLSESYANAAERAVLGIPQAVTWAAGHGATVIGTGINVGVIDEGVDPTAPDLVGRVSDGGEFCAAGGGVRDGSALTPSGWHGTAVATLLAGDGAGNSGAGTGTGVRGTAAGALIRAYQVFCGTAGAPSTDIAAAIRAATDQGMAVINLSLGAPYSSQVIADAVTYAQSHHVIVVAAAGNSGSMVPEFPAGLVDVISVGATTTPYSLAGGLAWFSSRGAVDVVAPGTEVMSFADPANTGHLGVSARLWDLVFCPVRRRDCGVAARGRCPCSGDCSRSHRDGLNESF